jgi:hypothetical protein
MALAAFPIGRIRSQEGMCRTGQVAASGHGNHERQLKRYFFESLELG